MKQTLSLKNKFLAGLFFMFSFSVVHAQDPGRVIFKKYSITDSSSVNKSAILVLYTDNTFLNFGIYDNKKAMDTYVWYKEGTWDLNGNTTTFGPPEKKTPEEQLKKHVKQYCRYWADRVLIESYYEFVHESLNAADLVIKNNQPTDSGKKIGYAEIKY